MADRTATNAAFYQRVKADPAKREAWNERSRRNMKKYLTDGNGKDVQRKWKKSKQNPLSVQTNP